MWHSMKQSNKPAKTNQVKTDKINIKGDLKVMTTVLRKWHILKLCLTHFLINLHLVD